MIKQYLTHSWYLIKQNKLLSIISILGTALAITMIMCIVLIFRARTANYEPEDKRDRMLEVGSVIARNKEQDGWNNGGRLSLRVLKECFYTLESAETVTGVVPYITYLATSPGNVVDYKCIGMATDDTFWKVFQFRFLSGKPYGEEFVSGQKKAVISRTLARKIYGDEDAVGKTLTLSFVDYTICGVVADVSVLAEKAYAEVWIPYTSTSNYESNYTDGLLGNYCCYMLAPDKQSLERVRSEVITNVERMNENQEAFKLMLFGGPDTQLMTLARDGIFDEPDTQKYIAVFLFVIFILLLVPAINLSGITSSRMRKRMEEIGVRRVFGASRGELLMQVLTENFVITLIGGVVGLLFSYLGVLSMREWLLNTTMSGYYGVNTAVSTNMLVSFDVFLYALLFCLLMNLLSAGIPAWRVSRANIVNAITQAV